MPTDEYIDKNFRRSRSRRPSLRSLYVELTKQRRAESQLLDDIDSLNVMLPNEVYMMPVRFSYKDWSDEGITYLIEFHKKRIAILKKQYSKLKKEAG